MMHHAQEYIEQRLSHPRVVLLLVEDDVLTVNAMHASRQLCHSSHERQLMRAVVLGNPNSHCCGSCPL